MLSFAGISTSVAEVVEMPSTLILKLELPELPILMDEIITFCALVLYTISRCVTEPIVVKTVSNKTVSVENFRNTEGLVSTVSFFLQDPVASTNHARRINAVNLRICFIIS